jgi:hypothetical protein
MMGDRFLLYRVNNGNEMPVAKKAFLSISQANAMRDEMQAVIHEIVECLEECDNLDISFSDGAEDILSEMAIFCSFARCPVSRDGYSKLVEYIPQPEGPARLVKQFALMAMALALVRGKKAIDIDVMMTIGKMAKDLIPLQRLLILEYMFAHEHSENNCQWVVTGME